MSTTIFSDFIIEEVVSQTTSSAIYRVKHSQSGQLAILKSSPSEYPDPIFNLKLAKEHRFLKDVHLTSLPRVLDFVEIGGRAALIFYDDGLISLDRWAQNETIPIARFIEIAIRIATTIGDLHSAGYIHKDIKPGNLLIDPKTNEIQLIDFSTVSMITVEERGIVNFASLEGTLAYMAPEQSGRMNRQIDYRSDYYSIGITFYELLTKKVPFEGKDAIEFVHAHIAYQAVPPAEVDKAIPQPLSKLVLKLMAKTAEHRYQSLYGLLYDLQTIRSLLGKDVIDQFEIGTKDRSQVLNISQKIYGREAEFEQLRGLYERSCGGQGGFVFISGLSGIGKTTLVRQLQRAIVSAHSYYAGTKQERMQADRPYATWAEILQTLQSQLQSRERRVYDDVMRALKMLLNDDLSWLKALLPEIDPHGPPAKIIDSHDDAAVGIELVRAIRTYIGLFTTRNQPLVISMDDLQWTTRSSFEFFMQILTDSIKNIFFIGSFRKNEVDTSHPLHAFVQQVTALGYPVDYIELQELTEADTAHLIADTLEIDPERCADLSQNCFKKTNGNPFFLKQFLRFLHDDSTIKFDPVSGSWTWDNNAIANRPVTDNVVTIMIQKLAKVPPAAIDLLYSAACFGKRFDLEVLAAFHKMPKETAYDHLAHCFQNGILVATSATNIKMFSHDQIYEAIYNTIGRDRRVALHGALASFLKSAQAGIFDILHQYVFCYSHLTNPNERVEVAQIFAKGGAAAIDTTAFVTAFQYFQIGLELLGKDAEQHPALWSRLMLGCCHSALLNNNLEKMHGFADELIRRVKDPFDAIPAHVCKIAGFVQAKRFAESIAAGIVGLRVLGYTIPKNPPRWRIILNLLRLKIRLYFKPLALLHNAPVMTDRRNILAMEVMTHLASASYIINSNIFPYLCIKSLEISMKYGQSQYSGMGYAGTGVIMWLANDLKTTFELSGLVKKTMTESHKKGSLSMISFVHDSWISPWFQPLSETLGPLRANVEVAMERGSYEYASYNAIYFCTYSFISGLALTAIRGLIEDYQKKMRSIQQEVGFGVLSILLQVIDNLCGANTQPASLCGTYFDYDALAPKGSEGYHPLFFITANIYQTMVAFLFRDFERGMLAADCVDIKSLPGSLSNLTLRFYDSLNRLAFIRKAQPKHRRALIRTVRNHIKKFKLWAAYGPDNTEHKLALVMAEYCYTIGNRDEASLLFEEAVELAKKSGIRHEMALANELAGRFYFDIEVSGLAMDHLNEAYYQYLNWGGFAKAHFLQREFGVGEEKEENRQQFAV